MTTKNKTPLEIWLEPKCCADKDIGQLWCDHDAWVCDEGNKSTKYTRATPDKVMIDKAELEKIKSVLEGYIGGAYGSNARWGLQILEAAMKGEG